MKRCAGALSACALAWALALALVITLLPLYGMTLYVRPSLEQLQSLGAAFPWYGGVGVAALTLLLAATGYTLWQALRGLLGGSRADTVLAACALSFVMVHFVPNAATAFYHLREGAAYTLGWALAFLIGGLWLAYGWCAKGKGKRGVLLAFLCAGTLLAGGLAVELLVPLLLLEGLSVRASLQKRRPGGYALLALWLLLCGLGALRLLGLGTMAELLPYQGLQVATEGIGGGATPLSLWQALPQALYHTLALMGHWFSLPLAAMALMVAVVFAPVLRRSPFAFARPFGATALVVALLFAQIVPTVWQTGDLPQGGLLNICYFTYTVAVLWLTLYWTGWWRRSRGEGAENPQKTAEESKLTLGVVAACAALVVAGCLAYHPDGTESYGPQNTAGGSAARSLLQGEASGYSQAWDAWQGEAPLAQGDEWPLHPSAPVPKVFQLPEPSSNDNRQE